MQFSDPPRRRPPETIVPMINVVFLLLIFFLMTAQIAPPDPFDVAPPEVVGDNPPAEGEFTLHLGPGGTLAFGAAEGEAAALAALAEALEAHCAVGGCPDTAPPPTLVLRADAGVLGARLAALMPKLGRAGFSEVRLVAVAK